MMPDFQRTFSGRRILITGHTGFKGSWLAIWLHRLGASVTGCSLGPPSTPNNFNTSRVSTILDEDVNSDIRNYNSIQSVVKRVKPEVVFHLAAQSLVRQSYLSPRETIDTNVLGTTNLLEALRESNHPCTIVVITTDKCYDNREFVWGYRESDPLGGHDPYSASKGACEIICDSYRRSFFHPGLVAQHGVKLATARAGNVIGGGDWAKDRIVTDLVRSLTEGVEAPVRNPNAIRPWQHVLEPLSGYLTIAERLLESASPEFCSAWNFGPISGDDAPVSALVELFCKEWGNGRWRDISDPSQPHEAACLRLSIEKALWKLNWRPRWRLSEAIGRTARWYKAHALNPSESTLALCLNDIAAYESSTGV